MPVRSHDGKVGQASIKPPREGWVGAAPCAAGGQIPGKAPRPGPSGSRVTPGRRGRHQPCQLTPGQPPPTLTDGSFRLIEAAQQRWRAVNAPHLVALVRAGATFHHGNLVERSDGQTDTAAMA